MRNSNGKIILPFIALILLLLGSTEAEAQIQYVREADTTLFSNNTNVSGSYLDPSSPGYTTSIDYDHSYDNLWGTMNSLWGNSIDTNAEQIRCDREAGEKCPEIRWNFNDIPNGNYEVYVKLGGGDYVGQNRNPEIDIGNGYKCVDMRSNPAATFTWTKIGSVNVNGPIVFKARAIGNCGETHATYLDAFKFVQLSNSGGGSWQNYTDLTISNPGGILTNYQVHANLTGGSFPTGAQPSGADIRFTDAGGAEFAYWIESWDYVNRSAIVWVNVTSIPAGASTLRMWYGNPSAGSVSNGDMAFLFFDNFNTFDATKWVKNDTHGTITVQDGYLFLQIVDPWYGVHIWMKNHVNLSNTGFEVGILNTYDPSISASGWLANGKYIQDEYGDGLNYSTYIIAHRMSESSRELTYWDGSLHIQFYTPDSDDGYHNHIFRINQTKYVQYLKDGILQATSGTTVSYNNSIKLWFEVAGLYPNNQKIDTVYIRNYISGEPTVSVGVETVSNSIGYSALVATGQNTYVQSSNGSFGLLLKGQTKTINNSVILNNTGDISAKVEARFNESFGGVFGLVSGANVLNATNFALGLPSTLLPLSEIGADVQVAVAPPGVTALDARLGVPSDQAFGEYSGTVVLTFSNDV